MAALGGAVPAAIAAEALVVGIVPRASPDDTLRVWLPFIDRLSKSVGVRFDVKLYEHRRDFEADFARGSPDLIFGNAYQLVLARVSQGYRPLVRANSGDFRGLLVVRVDSAVRQLADLRDAKIAFPSPTAFAASLYMRALLTDLEKLPFRPLYVETHRNGVKAVISGEAVAGGVASDIYAEEPESLRSTLRVIYQTPAIPPHGLAAHPRVASAVRNALARAVADMRRDADGRRLLDYVGLDEAVEADYDRDYKAIEALGLKKFAGG